MQNYLAKLYLPKIAVNDVIEIIILAYVIYKIMVWIKNTKAWNLLKGMIVVAIFIFVAYIFQLRTIFWIAQKTFGVGIIALVILFQPELRNALERIGTRRVFWGIRNNTGYERFSKKVADEIVESTFEMAVAKTGALIVIEQNMTLNSWVNSGIMIDGVVTSQLLSNIFEKNTPLHDGAVIISGNKVLAATCYLPISDNGNVDKSLGTRHRAALGISEQTDSLTIIVSEETGSVSIAAFGILERNLDRNKLMARLEMIRKSPLGLNPITSKN